MARCDVCGTAVEVPHHCTECGEVHCRTHRLPERHDCPSLNEWRDPQGVLDDETLEGSTDPAGGSDAWSRRLLGFVDGNVTYLFLSLMAVTFFLQAIAFPLLGYPIGSDVWLAVFTVSPEHPEYLWTWITSIFAHGGLRHLVINGFVIFLFGRLVEKYSGSLRYAALFLGGGILASVAQTSAAMMQGGTTGSLGASGAAFAIMGALTALSPRLRVYVFYVLPLPVVVYTLIYGGYTVYLVESGGIGAGGVAHLAHLGGLLAGIGYGVYLRATRDRRPRSADPGRIAE
ncbi:rhomboid family intramembrane serine protease [Halobacteriales archaeon QS_8_69_26]|nr:MAG: rhomboid family intramembrane serine protease [Halobacteriales archaeon QS_8_69_26]